MLPERKWPDFKSSLTIDLPSSTSVIWRSHEYRCGLSMRKSIRDESDRLERRGICGTDVTRIIWVIGNQPILVVNLDDIGILAGKGNECSEGTDRSTSRGGAIVRSIWAALGDCLQLQRNLTLILIKQIAPVRTATVGVVRHVARLQTLAAKSNFGAHRGLDFPEIRGIRRKIRPYENDPQHQLLRRIQCCFVVQH